MQRHDALERIGELDPMRRFAAREGVAGDVERVRQMIYAGEVAQPGLPLFSVIDLQQVELVIYMPTDRIGQVKLGQAAQVTVDAYPGLTFAGMVTHISDQAEFTPKNVQTQEERAHTVFAVKIRLDNASGTLKAGMPADARLRVDES